MKRQGRESPSEFTQRLGEEMWRNLKQWVNESGYPEAEAKVRFAAYSELARDVLLRNLPERVQNHIRAAGLATLEEEPKDDQPRTSYGDAARSTTALSDDRNHRSRNGEDSTKEGQSEGGVSS